MTHQNEAETAPDAAIATRRNRNAWHRRRRLLMAQGRWAPTEHRDPSEALQHLRTLSEDYGLSDAALSDLSGIPTRTIFEILDETRQWITPGLEARVLATEFDLDLLADGRRILPVGTHRRIRALMRLGWNMASLGAHLGTTAGGVSEIVGQAQVTALTARRIRRIYDELAMTPGPSPRGARLARTAGHPPPLAWDEGAIDDPHAQPQLDEEEAGHTGVSHFRAQADGDIDEIAVERALAGRQVTLTHAEAHAVARRAVARGMSDAQVAARVGVVPETILRWRQDCGLQSRYEDLRWVS